MLPVVNRALLLQVLDQASSHRNDAIGHALDLTQPQFVELRRVEHLGSDLSAMSWRVRVHATDGDFELAEHASNIVLVRHDERESAHSFAVQTHVLGERLRYDVLVAILGEEASGKGVLVSVAGCEALIG